MRARTIILLALKLIGLTLVYFVCFAIASAIAFPQPPGAATDQGGSTALSLLAVSLLNTIVLSYLILRSRWSGWRLSLAIFVVSYGVIAIMSQIETAVFVTRLPPGMLPRIMLLNAIVTTIFSPLAVLILGKRKHDDAELERSNRLVMPVTEWIWKLSVIAVAYVVLYFTFGYFIAWRSPAVREYYHGTDSGNFFVQMRSVLVTTPWLPFFQVLRGLMWTALALPVIRMMKGAWWEAALAVALMFSVVMNSQLLLPNPFMPTPVRMAHLLETATSNFIFGFFMVWLLTSRDRRQRSRQ